MIQFGIIGFGRHAVKRLMPGFALAKNSRLVALSRRDIKAARATAIEHKVALAFDSAEALCASPEVQAVFVTTPNSSHLSDVLTAIRAGKPVLCEKPMAINADECRTMIKAARSAGVLLGVAQCFRFQSCVRRMRQRVAAGQIGKPVEARADFGFWGLGHARSWISDAKVAGGGPISDVGVHCIDTLRYILNDEVVRVGTLARSDSDSGEVEASAALSLEFAGGTLAQVAVSFRTQYRTPLEIVGTEGVLRADDGLEVERPIALQLVRDRVIVETEEIFDLLTYARQVDAFSSAVENQHAFEVPGEEGLRNQLVLDAAYRSIRSGHIECVQQ